MNVAGYCRVSSEGQLDGYSIPQQKDIIENYCKIKEWTSLNSGLMVIEPNEDDYNGLIKCCTDALEECLQNGRGFGDQDELVDLGQPLAHVLEAILDDALAGCLQPAAEAADAVAVDVARIDENIVFVRIWPDVPGGDIIDDQSFHTFAPYGILALLYHEERGGARKSQVAAGIFVKVDALENMIRYSSN